MDAPNDTLYDMHCHMGFAANDVEVAAEAAAQGGLRALSCTVAPDEYVQQREVLAGYPFASVALGLHPWWVADGRCGEEAIERFCELAPGERLIGEVGLELTERYRAPEARQRQERALARALAACNQGPDGKLVSVHAVRATEPLLDALEAAGTCRRHTVVFHWYSDTPEGLKRAVAMGCCFSVGSYMLETRRGREYARIIPEDRLLLETDAPSRQGKLWSAGLWREQLHLGLRELARIRNVPEGRLAEAIAATSSRLLGAQGR